MSVGGHSWLLRQAAIPQALYILNGFHGWQRRRLGMARVWADLSGVQRQTVVSQFYQLDRLVVEGGKTVRSNPHNPLATLWANRALCESCCLYC